jgi:hypothetical protein
MQIVRERIVDRTTRLHEIMHDFTPPMRRVCPHLSDDDLRAMIERMALHMLEEELIPVRLVRRACETTPRSRRSPGARRAMTLAS